MNPPDISEKPNPALQRTRRPVPGTVMVSTFAAGNMLGGWAATFTNVPPAARQHSHTHVGRIFGWPGSWNFLRVPMLLCARPEALTRPGLTYKRISPQDFRRLSTKMRA